MINRLLQTLRATAASLLLLAPAAATAAQPGIIQASFNLHGLGGLPVYAINPGLVSFAGYRKGLG